MTRLVTMGTASCATISLAGFKSSVEFNNFEENEKYLNDRKLEYNPKETGRSDLSVQRFYDEILYPVEQELGETGDYPFDCLMDLIDKSAMGSKFIIATLNSGQVVSRDGYWPKRLKERGFQLIDKTNNEIGEVCYIYTRNENRVEIKEKDAVNG